HATVEMAFRVGVAKGHLDRGVAHQLSDRRLRVASVTELRPKRMPEVMPTEVGYARNAAGSLKRTLDLGELFSCRRVNKNIFTLGSDSPKRKQFFADVLIHRHRIVPASFRVRHIDYIPLEIDFFPTQI